MKALSRLWRISRKERRLLAGQLFLVELGFLSSLFCGSFLAAPDATAQTSCTPTPSGLISWWPGDGFALDVEGTNNGTLEDGASYAPGEVGQAFNFSASDAFVALPDNFFPFPTTGTSNQPFTFEVWFETSSGGVIFGQQNGPAYSSVSSYVPGIYVGTDGKLRAELFWSGSASPLMSTAVVNNGVFHHAAVTYDGTNQILYLNGVSIATNQQTQTAYASSYYYQFGTGYTANWPGGNGGWYQFAGLIDEPSLYACALKSTDIESIYSAGSAGKCYTNDPAPLFVQQPRSQSGYLIGTVNLAAAAMGTPRPSYQWSFNNLPLIGAINPSLVLSNLALANAGSYQVIASNTSGSITSLVAVLTVSPFVLFSANTTISATNTTYDGQAIIVSNATVSINGPHSFSSLEVATNGVVSYTLGQSNLMLTVSGDLTVDLGGQINVDGKGYGPDGGPGAGVDGGYYGGGGGGGYGGNGGGQNGGPTGGSSYGSLTAPTDLGSGGGNGNSRSGGYGGGAMQLVVGGTLTVNGGVSAAGLGGSGARYNNTGASGGGSGGSIWITTSNLAGAGGIAANGGGGPSSPTAGTGGGGGGRIALYYQTNSYTGVLSAFGASGPQYGGAGTIYTKSASQSWGQLTLDNGGHAGAGTVLPGSAQEFGQAEILGGGSMVLSCPVSFSSLHVATNCAVTCTLGQSNLFLTVTGDLLLDAGGIITVSGEGYQTGGRGAGGPVGLPAPVCAGGGGYGGQGGNGVGGGLGGGVYGSMTSPTDWGSAGGPNNPSMGSGGGAIRLIVGGNLTVSGTLSANGSSGVAWGNPVSTSGGGAGGSIWVTAGLINGAGAVMANGGSGAGYGWQYSGGGGGGRIAIDVASYAFDGTISVNGGVGFQSGQQGSIYFPPSKYSLNFDTPVSSALITPFSQDQWSFMAIASEVVQLDQISLPMAGVAFDLIGPGGWVGFTGITNESVPVALPLDGGYQVVVRRTGGIGSAPYAFRLHQLITVAVVPQGVTVAAGSAVTFSAVVTGVPPLSYQWRKNGVDIGGATNTTLTLSNVSTNNSGNYDVVVSNASGAGTNSPPAALIVAKLLTMTTLAGETGGIGGNNGVGSNARFWGPSSVAVDSAGNVYVADTYNSTIRKITPQGIVSTVAGLAGSTGSEDGPVGNARFYWPGGVAVDSAGNLYVADTYNSTIRKITNFAGVVTLAGLAGNVGSTNGTGSTARFNYPFGVAVDAGGNVYVADTYNSTIRKITANGAVSIVAGLAGNSGSADGTNGNARFNLPQGIAVDINSNIFVADTGNDTIREITPIGTNWVVSTLAGLAGNAGDADGVGTNAQFNYPTGLAVDGADNVYVADQGNNAIREIASSGTVSTLAGIGGIGSADGTGTNAQFWDPSGVAVDSAGNIYVADTDNNTIRVGQIGLFTPPLLQISPSGRQVVLFWPNSALGYVLESNGTLAAGVPWSAFTNAVGKEGGSFVVTNNVTGGGSFYRLHKP